ncbi:MAG: hypothetical protein OXL96_13875 [Candidatus Poribacteria bacterium]|nr:hypothetical protein [Candidatus Poribacteria bacterium]
MAATVLTSQHYDGLRALIAPDVTSEHFSDAYLSQRAYAPAAERKVRKRLRTAGVDVDDLTGENLEDARLAMMHECAAVLCLTAPQQVRQTLIQVQTEVQEIDFQEKRSFHLGEADELINDIIEDVELGKAVSTRKRLMPFGAVGTLRPAVATPCPISSRTVDGGGTGGSGPTLGQTGRVFAFDGKVLSFGGRVISFGA